eukprot:402929-Prymnesium_polylepis.1
MLFPIPRTPSPRTPQRCGLSAAAALVSSNSDPAKPQYDTFGGTLDAFDDDQYHRCALRELHEEFVIPRKWIDFLGLELASFSRGH